MHITVHKCFLVSKCSNIFKTDIPQNKLLNFFPSTVVAPISGAECIKEEGLLVLILKLTTTEEEEEEEEHR